MIKSATSKKRDVGDSTSKNITYLNGLFESVYAPGEAL
jgi:hypothetical protein